MYYREVCRILAFYLLGFSLMLLIPLALAVYYQFGAESHIHPQAHSTRAFALTIVITLAITALLYALGRNGKPLIYRREGIIAVVLIWFITPALSGLPFLLSGTLSNPWHAYFETTSGLTTTGATILAAKNYDSKTGKETPIHYTAPGVIPVNYDYFGTVDPIRDPISGKIVVEGIEAVGKALLFWRSFLQWLGGVGIVVLFVAILPALGIGGKLLLQSEVTGPIKDALTPRIKETAMQLWKIYLCLTALQVVALWIVDPKLPWLDAFTITFASLSTGGFSIRNANIAAYNSPGIEWVVIVFMILGSINFALYYFLWKGKFYKLYDAEFILFLALAVVASSITARLLIGYPSTPVLGTESHQLTINEAIRAGTFQVISANTSTGFATANYDIWPYIVQVIMLIMMFVGGMSGSTAGGIKTIRHFMIFKIVQNKLETLFRPECVRSFQVSDKEVDFHTASMVLSYFAIILSISVISTLIYVFVGIDPETSISLVGCMINNVGLVFRAGGPNWSCAFLSDFGLALSSFLMILGRLEFFAILALFVPSFWRRNS